MGDTKTVFEFEFGLTNGTVLYETAEGGRDVIAADAERVRLEIHEGDGSVREVIVNRAPEALAYLRTTKREVPVEEERAVVVS